MPTCRRRDALRGSREQPGCRTSVHPLSGWARVGTGVAAEQNAHLAGDGFIGEVQRLRRIVIDVALELQLVTGLELERPARRTVDLVAAPRDGIRRNRVVLMDCRVP